MGKSDLRKILSINVKHFRFINGLSQEQLAEKCELSPRYISDIENEKGNIPIDTLEKISVALKIRPYQLLKEQNVNKLPRRINIKK